MLKELLTKYSDEGNERIGFILDNDEIVELLNDHDDPENGAKFRSADLYAYLYDDKRVVNVKATWHTHPSATSNLSGDDYIAFRNHPQIDHYIIGNDGVTRYYVENGVVKRD